MRGAFASFLALFLFHFPSLKEWHWKVGKISLLLHRGLEMVASLLVEAHPLEVSGIFVRFPILGGLGLKVVLYTRMNIRGSRKVSIASMMQREL
jgi:hypothetical protein